MEQRSTNISIIERNGKTSLAIATNAAVDFEFDYKPQGFIDPRIAHLESVVESQRTEIMKVHAALVEARKTKRRRR